jgi:hypothetical protein
VVEARCQRSRPKIYDGPLGVAIPEMPLRAVDLCQRMGAIPATAIVLVSFAICSRLLNLIER